MSALRKPAEPDASPRMRPPRREMEGRYARLEPVAPDRHAPDLFASVSVAGGDRLWEFMAYGPFADEAALFDHLLGNAATDDPLVFVVRNLDTGRAEGAAGFLRINPAMGVVEVGGIWMAPCLQRTRAATEAVFLMMDLALTRLGYRRLEWKCDARNAASRAAALRYGFTYEGLFRQHMIVKGRNRDTAWFSLLDAEWPERRRRFLAWLDPSNFDRDGRQRRRLNDFA